MLRTLLSGIHHQVPSTCAVCHAWPAQPVCEDCIQLFAQPQHRCPSCALPLPAGLQRCHHCAQQPPAWDCAYAAVDYAYPWDRLLTDFKFRDHPAWARRFADLMSTAPWVEPALDAADWLIPMPLAPQRLKYRGYNQSALLARCLAPAKTAEGILLRVQDTAPQSSLPRQERLRNVQHAFVVDPLQAHRVRDQRLVLVDDVMTSGASMTAATLALRRAGALHVTALVFARTSEQIPAG